MIEADVAASVSFRRGDRRVQVRLPWSSCRLRGTMKTSDIENQNDQTPQLRSACLLSSLRAIKNYVGVLNFRALELAKKIFTAGQLRAVSRKLHGEEAA